MKKYILSILSLLFIPLSIALAQDKSDWKGGVPEGCTSITVGRAASFDGSVMTSHTDDSHKTRSWMDIQASANHQKNSTTDMFKRTSCSDYAMPTYKHAKIGEIPQVEHTFAYVNTAYPCMNEKQVAIGESTFGGREELQSDAGLIDCQRLCKLMLERSTTAREAIIIAGKLLKEYGWNDYGECLTIADKTEVWHLEIVGPGSGNIGAIWVAQRVPDNHIAVNANASTIKEIDVKDKKNFLASKNIFTYAMDNGYWNKKETFSFCYTYAPHSRESVAARRREWRVYDLLAPSLNLNPNDKDYPFSIKPDHKISLQDMIMVFKDYYQGTPYDMRNNILDNSGEISPLANPFMPYDNLEIQDVSGGWYSTNDDGSITFLGERTIARWYTMYGTIIQCRNWLPDEVGGVVWLAQDNIASSIYIPVYCSVKDVYPAYKVPGRPNGFTRESAWWAFNALGTLAAQRWGDMSVDIDSVWMPMQTELIENQRTIEREALKKYKVNREQAVDYLTDYTIEQGEMVVNRAWRLWEELMTKYDEKY